MMTTFRDKIADTFPKGGFKETGGILWDSWKMIITTMCLQYVSMISVLFCGHLGKEELDGVSLAVSTINIVGMSLVWGASTAFDTYFSQSFGSENKKQLSVYLQMSILMTFGMSLFCMGLYFNSYAILIGLGQDPMVARVCETYLLYFSPSLPVFYVFVMTSRYLQVQGFINGPLIIELIALGLNILMQYLLVIIGGYGVRGSALAHGSGFILLTVLLLIYILVTGKHKPTWTPWSRECLEGWGQVFKLVFSGFLLMCVELVSFEIGLFLTGLLGTIELGSAAILFQVETVLFACALGVSVTWTHRIGRCLGNSDADTARRYRNLCVLTGFIFSLILAIIPLAAINVIPGVYTSNQEIIRLTKSLTPYAALFLFIDAYKVQLSGIFRACGRQLLVAVVCFFLYNVIGFACAVPFMLLTWMRTLGYWVGINIGAGLGTIAFIILLFRINWKTEVQLAEERLQKEKSTLDKQQHELPESKALLKSGDVRRKYLCWLLTKRLAYFLPILVFFTVSLVLRIVHPPYLDFSHSNSTETP